MKSLINSTAIAFLLSSTAGFADITAEDAWNGLTAYYRALGATVDATGTRNGDTLNISDLKITMNLPAIFFPDGGAGSVVFSTTGFDLTENGDGTVAFHTPETMPVAIALTLPGDQFSTVNLEMHISGENAVFSGDPDNFTVAYSADSYTATLVDFSSQDAPPESISGHFLMERMNSTSTFHTGDWFDLEQDFSVGTMQMGYLVEFPDGKGKIDSSATYDEYDTHFQVRLPKDGIDFSQLATLLRDGLMLELEYSVGAMTSLQDLVMVGGPGMHQEITAESAIVKLDLSKVGAGLDVHADNYDFNMSPGGQPSPSLFPIKGVIEKMGATFLVPLLKSDADQDFHLGYDLRGITVRDEIWAMADPAGGFPHTPARLTFDLTGKIQLAHDLANFEEMKKLVEAGSPPGEVHSVALDNLNIAAVGATLTGAAAFTLDNSDMVTFPGFPALDGSAQVELTGANALLDTLTKLGLVPDDQAMGARMMMGIFMKAGEGDDTLTSKIDVSPDGKVFANGQRLK
jgi:hypothetical protein